MMHKTDNQSVGSLTKTAELDCAAVQSGVFESEQAVTDIRHELVNANHAILLGANLLSRYWDDIISSLDQYDGRCDDDLFSSDDCLEARKNGAMVIASIVASARKIEARLAGLKEGVKHSAGNTA
ncbi:hypothetical protein SAMN02745119_00783 [Trichlorobacter thiogenes]|uniref:Uncharacterized protein n=1 Tax=Trichlorobacter thiogenes TaxID=115783 RepID=A0A1T4L5P2_9BACT|nr:hypothetical protein [Trichlorobacter thiogenes]SJZ50045.1 hypothetical protein SAMN02745119_00783 [Trichlorobacter thiogenes]